MPESKGRKTKQKKRPYVPKAAPKKPAKRKPSSKWYIGFVIGLGVLGVLVIVLNYMGLVPTSGGSTQPHFLWIGLGFIAGCFIAATRLR
ncbi:MAG: cell division protein CrgA [Actinomycetota bacterium]